MPVQTETISEGTKVSYEDMANPRSYGTVADTEHSEYGASYVIAWHDGPKAGTISSSDCRQYGWRVER